MDASWQHARLVIVLVVTAMLLAACDRSPSSPAEPLMATRGPATQNPPPALEQTRALAATHGPADASPATTAAAISTPSSSVEVSPLLSATQVAAIPTACSPLMLHTLFEALVQRSNAGDVGGIVALLQPEQGDPALDGAHGAMPFQGYAWGTEPAALTHAQVRAALLHVLADGSTLRLSLVQFGPSVDTLLPGGPRSMRNANVSVEMLRWTDPAYPQAFSGKGIVDCVSGRIIVLTGGPGALGF